jgi:uracil-DNA glycosylase
MTSSVPALRAIHGKLKSCRLCPNVCDRAVHGEAIDTRILLVGQAPGAFEGTFGKPFAHKAGKTLFKWLETATGADEETVREMIYFSAVARCFPGKAKSGAGDRVPSKEEIANCRPHLQAEIRALRPKLLLAVGRLAISEILGEKIGRAPLVDTVGKSFRVNFDGEECVVIPLPHPSGVSRWPVTEPGKTKLTQALKLLRTEFRKLA